MKRAGPILIGAIAAIVLVLIAVTVERLSAPKPVAPIVTKAPAPASQSALPPANCLLPGPAPVVPDGRVVTAEEMKAGHDRIQAFVLQLEAYQACRNAQHDHAGPGVSDKQKQAWTDEGDSAVDEANALAREFSAQLGVFKQLHPDTPPSKP